MKKGWKSVTTDLKSESTTSPTQGSKLKGVSEDSPVDLTVHQTTRIGVAIGTISYALPAVNLNRGQNGCFPQTPLLLES